MPAAGVLVGIVGYTPVLDAYPLGPRLMAALQDGLARVPGGRVENMTWSPIHIVQRFEDAGAERPSRLVLVGAAATSSAPGAVRAFRWKGGTLPAAAVQARIYEAVTGIVDIENTLMIGEHFGVWPRETYTVEVDMAADTFGRMVIADSAGRAGDALNAELGFSPASVIAEIARLAVALARSGEAAEVSLRPKSVASLVPVAPFIRNFARCAAVAGDAS